MGDPFSIHQKQSRKGDPQCRSSGARGELVLLSARDCANDVGDVSLDNSRTTYSCPPHVSQIGQTVEQLQKEKLPTQ
ncbi:hypothetical protein TMatcc_000790 [Talaromyces marneffei ATCC 18224]